MSQFDATRRGSSCLNCVKIRRWMGLRPRPHWGVHSAPLAASKGMETGKKEREEGGGRDEESPPTLKCRRIHIVFVVFFQP